MRSGCTRRRSRCSRTWHPLTTHTASFSNLGRYPDALARFRRVTELQPDGPRGWANLGSAYQGLGDYTNARIAYEKSIAVDPTAAGYSNLGTFHFAIGQYAEASRAYEKAVELAPSDYIVRANLGDAYRWTPGMREKSIEPYQRSITIAREWLEVNLKDPLARRSPRRWRRAASSMKRAKR